MTRKPKGIQQDPAPVPMLLALPQNVVNLVTQVPAGDLRDLGDLSLPPSALETVNRVLDENRKTDALAKAGLRANNRILLCGPPGCGKTVTAGAIAKVLGLPMFKATMESIVESFLGATGSNLRKVFDVARTNRIVLFLDEMDSIGRSRDSRTDEIGEMKRVTNSLLTMLEEMRGPSLVICATNHEVALDAAMWRRFDEIIVFPIPTRDEAISFLLTLTTRHLFQGDRDRAEGMICGVRDRDHLKLDGMSFADIERVATDAAKSSLLTGEHVDRAIIDAILRQTGRMAMTGKAP